MLRWEANAPRYRGDGRGHYESYFLRANHPTESLGFWIRYTIFEPSGRPDDARAEIWAAVFNSKAPVAVRAETPLAPSNFVGNSEALDVRVGHAVLRDDPLAGRGMLRGAVVADGREIRWDLVYDGGADPLLLLPERLYHRRFPKAKALVPVPMARFDGQVAIDGEILDVAGWVGSQNHNWGTRHTDEYAWGQVAGFDDAPDSFLECSTARLKLAGSVRTPWLSPMVLRHEGRQYALTDLRTARRTKANYDTLSDDYVWGLRGATAVAGTQIDVTAEFRAPRSAFVVFDYANPPGGTKTCLNTKIAECTVLIAKAGAQPVVLRAANRAAFEILS